MKLARALEEKILDLRLRDKFMSEGKLSKKEVEDYLTSVEDASDNGTFLDKDQVNKTE